MRGLSANTITLDDLGYNQSEETQVTEDNQSEETQVTEDNQSEETQVTEDNQSEENITTSLDSINEMINNTYNSRRYLNVWSGLCEEMSSSRIREIYYQPSISDNVSNNQTSALNPARINGSLDSLHRVIGHLRSLTSEQMGNLSRTRTEVELINTKIDKIEHHQKTIDEKLDFIIGLLNTLELGKML